MILDNFYFKPNDSQTHLSQKNKSKQKVTKEPKEDKKEPSNSQIVCPYPCFYCNSSFKDKLSIVKFQWCSIFYVHNKCIDKLGKSNMICSSCGVYFSEIISKVVINNTLLKIKIFCTSNCISFKSYNNTFKLF